MSAASPPHAPVPCAPLVLLTDFGTRDWFVGVMKGVITGRAPGLPILDLCHEVPPGDLQAGALMLEAALPYYPADSVFCCVVDPGVGTDRRILIASYQRNQAGQVWIVGPDNGLIPAALQSFEVQPDARPLTTAGAAGNAAAPRFFAFDPAAHPEIVLPDASTTFHGRDVFAPLAAHLALQIQTGSGIDAALADLTMEIQNPVRLAQPPDAKAGDPRAIHGRVRYIDRFGNLITDLNYARIRAAHPDRSPATWEAIAGRGRVRGLSVSYGEHARGAQLMYVGSLGYLEIAVNMGHAGRELKCAVGTPVELYPGTTRP